jgi:MFS family permease
VTTTADPRTRRLLVFFAAVYFVQGFAEPKAGIASQPIFFLLKEELRLAPGDIATFFAVTGIAWAVKPLYGLLSDLVPLFGYRRRSYLLLTTAMAALGWLTLGLLPGHAYGPTLAILSLTGLGLAFTDVLCDAVMVEEGRPRGLTARFQSVQWSAIYGASLLAGIGGGYLSAYVPYHVTFLLVAAFPTLSFAASAWAVRDPPTRFDAATVRTTLAAIRSGLRSGPLLRAAVFLFLWNFAPSFGVPLQVHMVDVLGISKVQLGWLSTTGSGAMMAGALAFGGYLSGRPIKPLLNVAVGIGVATTLAYYGLVGWWSAMALAAGVGFVTAVAFLATMDLAARAVPSQAEGTFFAALMSVNNIGTAGSQWLGGLLYDRVGLGWLIAISATSMATCWLLVPWVRVAGDGRDAAAAAPPAPPAAGAEGER